MWERIRKAKRDHPPPPVVLRLYCPFSSRVCAIISGLVFTTQEAALSNIKIAPTGRVTRLHTVRGTRLSLSLKAAWCDVFL